MKKIFLFIFFMFIFTIKVNAEACDAYDIKRLKEIANGVEITYELQEPNVDIYGDTIYDSYDIFINGLTSEYYFKFFDVDNDFVNFENKNILDNQVIVINDWLSGNYRVDIYSKTCDVLVNKVNVELPKYNIYYENSICEDYRDKLGVCGKWYSDYVDINIINKEINKFEEKNKSFFEKNIVYIVIGVTFVIIFIVVNVFKRRKEVLT